MMAKRCKSRSFYAGIGADGSVDKVRAAYCVLPDVGAIRSVSRQAGEGEINVQELMRQYNDLVAQGWDGQLVVPAFHVGADVLVPNNLLGVPGEIADGISDFRESRKVAMGHLVEFDPSGAFGRNGRKASHRVGPIRFGTAGL
jgi:hypothetical protein